MSNDLYMNICGQYERLHSRFVKMRKICQVPVIMVVNLHWRANDALYDKKGRDYGFTNTKFTAKL